MSGAKKADFLDATAAFLSSTEGLSSEQLDAALEKEGVDVQALLADVAAITAAGKRRQRELWTRRMAARSSAITASLGRVDAYRNMPRTALVAEVTRRAQAGAHASFHGYREASDEDLRAMLDEFDAVGGPSDKEE